MQAEQGEPHNLPHIHVYYGDETCSISIMDGQILAGTLSKKKYNLILRWILKYKFELCATWKLLCMGKTVKKDSWKGDR
jgi:hypothetical protein